MKCASRRPILSTRNRAFVIRPRGFLTLDPGSKLEMGYPRAGYADQSPAVDGRKWRGRHFRYCGRAAKRVDDVVGDRLHNSQYAIVATNVQANSCDNRDCDIRSVPLDGGMDLEEIRAWAKAKRGRQKQLAEALGIDQDMVSKSLSPAGTRRFTALEMDIARSVVRDDLGLSGEGVRTIPLLGSVPAGSWREAVRNPRGRLPVPDTSVPDHAYALEPDGDSMDRVAAPGSKIILDPQDTDLFPGRYYVVLNEDGETTFKQYMEQPARLVPCSSNPKHQEIVLGDGQFYKTLARVIGVYSRI